MFGKHKVLVQVSKPYTTSPWTKRTGAKRVRQWKPCPRSEENEYITWHPPHTNAYLPKTKGSAQCTSIIHCRLVHGQKDLQCRKPNPHLATQAAENI